MQRKGLSSRDRAFLFQVADNTWANHMVVALALLRTGSGPDHVATYLADEQNRADNRQFLGLPEIDVASLGARIQTLIAIRIWQEYMAALESTAALMLALQRRSAGGVLWQNWSYGTRSVTQFYEEASDGTIPFEALCGLPPIRSLCGRCPVDLVERATRFYAWGRERLNEVAREYLIDARLAAPRLDHYLEDVPDPALAILMHAWPEGREAGGPKGHVLWLALSKLKHGFNVSVQHNVYRNAGADTMWVLPIGWKWEDIESVVKNIRLLGVLCRGLALLALDLDVEHALG